MARLKPPEPSASRGTPEWGALGKELGGAWGTLAKELGGAWGTREKVISLSLPSFLFSLAVLDVRSGYPLCIKCHKYQIIACLMFGTFLVPSGQLLLLLEGPTADYGIQGFSMPDRVLPWREMLTTSLQFNILPLFYSYVSLGFWHHCVLSSTKKYWLFFWRQWVRLM